jgi:hypothetical protein
MKAKLIYVIIYTMTGNPVLTKQYPTLPSCIIGLKQDVRFNVASAAILTSLPPVSCIKKNAKN